MRPIVFAGPSLGRPDPAWAARIDFRPPARCGDVTRAVADRPPVIGLIDGFFETTAAVWYKEIIFAMDAGIAVYGAASMGALRAVELAPFGMIGIGEVFRLYRDGVTEDDDEVAVLHGPAEIGYPAVTEAMVNIRATLDAAVIADVLSAEVADALRLAAKGLFYKDRCWTSIEERAALPAGPRARFAAWRRHGAVDVKRQDARLLVEAVLNHRPATPPQPRKPVLNRTTYWASLEKFFLPPPGSAS